MSGSLLFCAFAALIGWVLAKIAAHFAMSSKRRYATVQRVSYGGVTRACMPVGGVILAVAMASFWASVGVLGKVQLAGTILFIMGFALGCLSVSRGLLGGLLLLLSCTVPDPVGAAVGALLAPVLKRQAHGADLVPGIPGALFAPALLGGGAFLVLVHGDQGGLLALSAGGALAGLQPWHRFPPRLTLGPCGVAVLAGATGLLIWQFLQHGFWLALLLLWSFVWVEAAARCWRGRAWAIPPFECARLRGEPEIGLTLASLSLSLAGVVLLWTVFRQPLAVQIMAIVAILALQLQFCAFLTRDGVSRPLSTEPPATSPEG